MRRDVLLAGACAFAVSTSSFGAGFALYEGGVRGTSLGGSLMGAADDPSALYYNPAGITRLEGLHLQAGFVAIQPESETTTRTRGVFGFRHGHFFTLRRPKRLRNVRLPFKIRSTIMDHGHLVSRRHFLRSAAVAGAALGAAGLAGRAAGAGPARSVMGFKVPKMDKVRIGLVGLGMRGSGAVGRLLQIEGVEITALCDIRPECVARSQDALKKKGRGAAKEFGATPDDWKRMCGSADVDLVYNCTPWDLHTPISVHAMNEGKHAATEVPAAVTLEECWQLVDTAERTQRHCMMLENCCYGEIELLALNLCRQGLLGELIHGEAAYIHDLRGMKWSKSGSYQGMWRLQHSIRRNGNLYPTHGLGPVAQYMGINRGDRFDYLSSISSMERGMTLWAEKNYPPDDELRKRAIACGDMNTTIIRTCKGRTIMVQHDTTSPRPYTRHNLISGTKGILADYPPRLALEPKAHGWMSDEEFKKHREQYMHPLWKRVGDEAKKVGGHGGMDFIMDWRLVYCLRNGEPLDQDVYDAAAWSAVGPLSEQSVARRGASVDVPDFTRGVWEKTPPLGIIG